MDLLGTDSATINAPELDFVEDRQHYSAASHQEGGRPQGKGSPRGGREDTPFRPPASTTSSACLHSFGGESSGRCSVKVSVDPGLAARSQGVSPDISPQGSPQIDIFASRQSAQTSRFFSCDAADAPDASTHSARGGTSSWPSSSLRLPFSRGLSGSWKGPGGRFSSSPRTGKPRRGLRLSKCFAWRTFAVFPSAMTSST
jgi:hypothetical protein